MQLVTEFLTLHGSPGSLREHIRPVIEHGLGRVEIADAHLAVGVPQVVLDPRLQPEGLDELAEGRVEPDSRPTLTLTLVSS